MSVLSDPGLKVGGFMASSFQHCLEALLWYTLLNFPFTFIPQLMHANVAVSIFFNRVGDIM